MEKTHELKVVSIRMVEEPPLLSKKTMDSSVEVLKVMAGELEKYDRELFCILNMRKNNQIINMNVVTMGSLDASIVSPREVFKSSILSNAAAIMLVHNHPSGRCRPSKEDMAVTRLLQECGEMLGIHVLDHIITGSKGEYFSFYDNGIMPEPGKVWERIAEESRMPCDESRKRKR